MKADSGEKPATLALSDAAVASLEDYLPGGSAAGEDGGKALQDEVIAMLAQLDRRLSTQSRAMTPTEEFRKLVAARQAVQAAKLAMQLHHAGRQGGKD